MSLCCPFLSHGVHRRLPRGFAMKAVSSVRTCQSLFWVVMINEIMIKDLRYIAPLRKLSPYSRPPGKPNGAEASKGNSNANCDPRAFWGVAERARSRRIENWADRHPIPPEGTQCAKADSPPPIRILSKSNESD
jgi:hypothetical protein